MARKKRESPTNEDIKMEGQRTKAKKCIKSTNEKLNESDVREDITSHGSVKTVSTTDKSLINLNNPAQEVPILKLHSGKERRPSGKLKLQLFPIDLRTRVGLEKDGFHPYLELTLNSWKKVASVVKRLHSKWGSSQMAKGELMLYPYENSKHCGYKWTMNSSNVTAGDVHSAIGGPAVFRLRYGWSSETISKPSEAPSNPISLTTYSHCDDNKAQNAYEQIGDGNKATNLAFPEKSPSNVKLQSEGDTVNDLSGTTFCPWDDLTNLSIGGLLSEVSMNAKLNNSKSSNGETATLWVENLTNMSIGGFLSEESLQGRLRGPEQDNNQAIRSVGGLVLESSPKENLNDCEKSWNTSGSNASKSRTISDSLDAFHVNRANKPPGSRVAPSGSHSSILDAEDTCHAFSFANLASSRKLTTISNEGQDRAASVMTPEQAARSDKRMKQKAQSEFGKQLLSSPLLSQECSLGLSGIKWGDSSGQFDIFLSSTQKHSSGDSISFGAILNNIKKTGP